MAAPTRARRGCSLRGNISIGLAVGEDMSKRKSPYTVATSADRPELSAAQFLQASQEANLLAAELQQQAQVLIAAKPSTLVDGPPATEGAQISKSTTMRLRGLVEILAGEE